MDLRVKEAGFADNTFQITIANWAMIIVLVIRWLPIAPWWAVIIPAVIIAILSFGDYTSAFPYIFFILLIAANISSFSITPDSREQISKITDQELQQIYNSAFWQFVFYAVVIIALLTIAGLIIERLINGPSIKEGKKVKIYWGKHKGCHGIIETVDNENGVIKIALKESDDVVILPRFCLYTEPEYLKKDLEKFKPGHTVKVKYLEKTKYGKIEEVRETYVCAVKIEDVSEVQWYSVTNLRYESKN
ncbi:MAG: hypothetical protein ACYTFY_08435 [Planctomycetota bacterium]|jgi:hypothetical protein